MLFEFCPENSLFGFSADPIVQRIADQHDNCSGNRAARADDGHPHFR
jgi:hypothetical protein